jgi:beta-glucosidase/6-phospho-beta-glucosidase/beta-galactosidase
MRRANLIALTAAATLLGAAVLGATPALAANGEPVFFEAPNALLTPATRAKTITQLQSLGVHALRVIIFWRDVAPDPNGKRRPNFNQANPAAYDWGAYDPLLAAAAALHWKILLTVSGPVPRWSTPHGEDIYSDPSAADFGKFMEAVGRHFGKRVKLFSIWNEPNEPASCGRSTCMASSPRRRSIAASSSRATMACRPRGTSPA